MTPPFQDTKRRMSGSPHSILSPQLCTQMVTSACTRTCLTWLCLSIRCSKNGAVSELKEIKRTGRCGTSPNSIYMPPHCLSQNFQLTKTNEEIYKTLSHGLRTASGRLSGAYRHLAGSQILKLEFAPYINRIISPPLRPVRVILCFMATITILTVRLLCRSTARLSDPKNASYFRGWLT